MLTRILIARHNLGEVLAVAESQPPGPHHRYAVALAYQALGRRGEADRALEELISEDSNGWAYQIAEVYALRGESAVALNWLERAYRQRDSGLLEMKIDPALGSIRGDLRYKALLRKVGLPET